MTYGKPTWKSYNDPRKQWREWKRQANELPIIELQRHAAVSKDNRHSCRDCFCCAAVELLAEKQAEAMKFGGSK